MRRTHKIIIGASVVLSLLLVGGALLLAQNRQAAERAESAPQAASEQRPVSKEELAAATGKDGNKCYVAVDNTVYEIKDFSLWQNGQHKPSGGEAYCGADMSAVIDKSPHGRKILDLLIEIGPLQA